MEPAEDAVFGRDVDYRPIVRDGAARAAALIAETLCGRGQSLGAAPLEA